jgi:hypothetical protein
LGARSGSCRRERLTVPATGAVRIADGGLAPHEVCGRHHGGEFAMEVRRCRSCQFIGAQAARVEAVRGVQHEEDVETNVRARPHDGFTAIARCDAAHGDAVAPLLAQPGGQVGRPRERGGTDFATSRSGSPVMTSLKAFPRLSGLSGEPCSRESWRTNTTGRAASRHAAISSAMLLRRPGSRSRAPLPSVFHGWSASEVAPTAPQSQGGWEPVGSSRGDCPVRVAMTRPCSRSTTCSRRPGLVRTYASDPALARISVGSFSSTWKARSPSGS